ncbi:MAG: HAD family hydrolase [Alphaproteobacteria bacterium]
MSAQKKFIVWDWNGTLLNDTDAVVFCVNAILAKVNHAPITAEFFRDIFLHPIDQFYRSVGLNEEELRQILDLERDAFHDYYNPMAQQVALHQGATEILQALKHNNVSSLIVSNHITDEITHLLKQHNIDHHFDEVIAYISRGMQFRDMTKGQKLQDYIKANGLNGSNALIIGDTMEEIEIARELGMTSVAITGGVHAEHRLRAKEPDYVIHSLHELKPILQERGFIS